jgi:integrase
LGYTYDPYGGYLHGAADVIRAQGDYLILREKAIQERVKTQDLRRESRRKELEAWYWEREYKATMREKEAERDRASMIKTTRTDFKRPSKKDFRVQRARQGPRLFTAGEIRRMLDAAGVQLRAMLLLAINAGFGNSDCGNLPLSAVDLGKGIIDFPRPKTGLPRRCVLWPETVEAIKKALANRPEPKKEEHAGLVFLTRCGDSWHTGTTDGPLSWETSKLLRKLGINGRHRLGFYCIRHTFRTVADEAKDQPAADFIMGHEVPHMSAVYRETISDARLKAVTDHVHAWLFAENGSGG